MCSSLRHPADTSHQVAAAVEHHLGNGRVSVGDDPDAVAAAEPSDLYAP
jgi:hypothetical protein